jgi:hypothetical protein
MIRNCNCRCNASTIITGTTAVVGTDLVITPTTAITPENEDRLSIVITNSITVAGMTLPVLITLGGAQVPIYDKFGNIVYGASLRANTIIRGYYGVNGSGGTAHVQVVNQPFTVCGC